MGWDVVTGSSPTVAVPGLHDIPGFLEKEVAVFDRASLCSSLRPLARRLSPHGCVCGGGGRILRVWRGRREDLVAFLEAAHFLEMGLGDVDAAWSLYVRTLYLVPPPLECLHSFHVRFSG